MGRKKTGILAVIVISLILIACSGTSQNNSTTLNDENNVQEAENITTEKSSKKKQDQTDKSNISTTDSKKYETSTAKCAHNGCNNVIASSGDTNYCTKHSNRCLECNKYIDEDAMYCMSCLEESIKNNSSSVSSKNDDYNSSKNNSSGKVSGSGEGGYDMPNENDESFSDYVKRVDPELYDSMFE